MSDNILLIGRIISTILLMNLIISRTIELEPPINKRKQQHEQNDMENLEEGFTWVQGKVGFKVPS